MEPISEWSREANEALALALRCVPDGGTLRSETLLAALAEVTGLRADARRLVRSLPRLEALRDTPPQGHSLVPEISTLIEGSRPGMRRRQFADACPAPISAESLLLVLAFEGDSGDPDTGAGYLSDRRVGKNARLTALRAVTRRIEEAARRLVEGTWKWVHSTMGFSAGFTDHPPGGARYLEFLAGGSARWWDQQTRTGEWEVRTLFVEHGRRFATLLRGSGLPVVGVVRASLRWDLEVQWPAFDAARHTYRSHTATRPWEQPTDDGTFQI